MIGNLGMEWKTYSLDLIPQWCQMSLRSHFDGQVAEKGVEHCRFCEFNFANAGKSEQELIAGMRSWLVADR